jgi:hypothetical protein
MDLDDKLLKILGKTVEEATQITGMIIRATMIDGQPMVTTCDYRFDRLNVSITDGKISGVTGPG